MQGQALIHVPACKYRCCTSVCVQVRVPFTGNLTHTWQGPGSINGIVASSATAAWVSYDSGKPVRLCVFDCSVCYWLHMPSSLLKLGSWRLPGGP